MNPVQFKDGLFNQPHRRFGSVSELIMGRILGLQPSTSNHHDFYDEVLRQRIEIKSSVVRKSLVVSLSEKTLFEYIAESSQKNRVMSFSEWEQHVFDCNIQQIKREEFDLLYYNLFFYDRILVFSIKADEIGAQIGYSDKQHMGNVGEGQFHVTQKSLPFHLQNYLYGKIEYEAVLKMLGGNSENET